MKKIVLAVVVLVYSLHIHAQDLKLWYKQPAAKWTEALPIGNGRIGAMVYGGIDNDHIQFNEETLWNGGPREYSRPGAYRYLDSIRNLLFANRQKDAETLGEKEFMGLKSFDGEKNGWVSKVTADKKYASEIFNDDNWPLMNVPSWDGWETVGHEGLDGAVWLRAYFTIKENWQPTDMLLDIGRIRDYDITYINGVQIGSEQNAEPRKYVVKKEILHKGRNTIAVLVLNFSDKGGIYGFKDTTKSIGIYPVNNEAAKISLNGKWKYLVVDDNPPPVGIYQAAYQPFGDINLVFSNTSGAVNYRRELDLSTATASTSYTLNGIQFKREYFVSAPNQSLVIQLTASEKRSIDFKAILSSPHTGYSITKLNGNTIVLSVQVRTGALHGKSFIQVKTNGGELKIENSVIKVVHANEATIYLTAGTNYKNYNDVTASAVEPCKKALASLAGKTFADVKAAHVKEYQHWFNTFSIKLGADVNEKTPTDERLNNFAAGSDPSFAALYTQYGRYLLISSSRPGTRPANLQGIWNDLTNPPWGSKYTTNINAEMNYWPAELLNLSHMHEPLFAMIKELSLTGKLTAQDHYNAPGWVLHHNTDLWRGTAPINAANHGIWVTGGAWLCQHLWEHYLFTRDKNFLQKKAYPIMKEAALFFNSFLIKDPATGYLISTPSNSPEQGGLVAGPTMDHQIIRALFKSVIDASEILKTDAEFRKTLLENYKQIAPNKIGRYGQLQEWMKDVDAPNNKHRHISHLWGMYPGHEINYDESPALMQAAKQSLLFRGDDATGWSLAWKINCWARFKDAEHTYTMIKMLLSPTKGNAGSYPNLFDAHPPFQIDGNFGGAAGVGEMLIQSHTAYIDLLPALPVAFNTGEVKGLCARGGFVFDLKWSNGQLSKATIFSKVGATCKLRYNGKVQSLNTKAGAIYVLDGNLNKL